MTEQKEKAPVRGQDIANEILQIKRRLDLIEKQINPIEQLKLTILAHRNRAIQLHSSQDVLQSLDDMLAEIDK